MDLTNVNNKFQKNRRKPAIDLSTMVYGKIPPQAKEMEESILGAIMLEKNAFHVASEIVKKQSFYVDAHQRIFKAFTDLAEKGSPIDELTVVEQLKVSEELDIVGGPYAITKLTGSITSSANIETHCRIIQQKYIQREMIRISGETIAEVYEDSTDVFDMVDGHEAKIVELTSGIIRGNFQDSQTLATKAIERVDFLRNNVEQLSGVPSGFPCIDRMTNGWQATDMIILAARPSVGKTAFALNLLRNAAIHPTKPTAGALFSLEMSAMQITNRIISTESKVLLERISRGRFDSEEELENFRMGAFNFSEMPIFIDDTPALNIFEFRAKARRLVNKHKVGLIIIDYLQLMSGLGNGNREQEISHISRNIKSLAKELQVPIIALSQMSRDIEKRKGEPMLSDLRESGAIEQDADMVMFLYRDDYQKTADDIDPALKNKAVLKIAKHRNGDLDRLAFDTDLKIQTWYDAADRLRSSSNQFPHSIGNWKKVEQEVIPTPKNNTGVMYTDNVPPVDDSDDLPF